MLNRVPNALPFEVDGALFDLLLQAMEVSWLSNGAFDVTVGPLVNLWGFGPQHREGRIPSAAEIAAARENIGYQNLVFNIADSSVQKNRPVTIDLSAIAKGYGVDQVAELLRQAGIKDFMVEIGGELYLSGTNALGKPWRIAIEQPGELVGQVHRTVNISNAAMATSGSYRNYFEVAGKRYSHTIDPRSGKPVTHKLVSVTVVADNCAYADALATAIDVMGPEQGLKLANEQGLAVYLISRGDNGLVVNYSDAFAAYLD
jgi:thiamine biosynthesis lipoprotein